MLRFLLLLILIAFVARAFWRLIDGVLEGARSGRSVSSRSPKQAHGVQMVRDPVCGTFLVPERAVTMADGNRQLFFCSTRCRDKFQARSHSDRPVEGRPV